MTRTTISAAPGANRLALVATGLYVLWGVLHVGLGASMLVSGLSAGGLDDELRAESTMFFVSAVVFGVMAIAVALSLNRVNDRTGFWLNFGLLGAIDLAFLVVLVFPGHVDPIGGLSGPVVWLAAAVVSALARPVSRS